MTAIAQSPNSASLGRYGEYPVNESVGLADIRVPIYEVNVGNIRFPVELAYHASGIKVADVASWAGLGFSLNAGGMITRKVMGLADELNTSDGKQGFFYKYSTVSNGPATLFEISSAYPYGQPFSEFKVAIDEGRTDYMPDVFSYNFAGKSGTFTLRPEGTPNNLTALTAPYDDIAIQTHQSAGKIASFIITDDDGITYTFNQVEVNYENLSTTHPTPPTIFDESINTSWYISNIADPKTGAAVSFSYEIDSIETDKFWTYQKTDLYSSTGGACPHQATVSRDAFSRIKTLRLKEINYTGTRIVFNVAAAPRQDVLNTKALETIDVYINNQLVQKTKLVTDYFSNGPNPVEKRLKLEKMQMLDPVSNAVIGEHTFEYYSGILPSRISTEQDLWGYYRSGALQFPTKTVVTSPGGYHNFKYNSESRSPSATTIASSLNKIIYPTGGYSKFNFENNTYHRNDPIYQDITRTNATAATTQNYATPITSTFTITQQTMFSFEAIISPSKIIHVGEGSPLAPCLGGTGSTALYKSGTSNPVRVFQQNETQDDWELDPGTYYFQSVIIEEPCSNAMVRVYLTEKKIIGYGVNYTGPGLRIQSIENYDQYSNLTQKINYIYENDVAGQSSGILYNEPKVVTEWEAMCPLAGGTTGLSKYFTSHFNNQIVAAGSVGASIYYKQVSKVYEGADNGKVSNQYSLGGLPYSSSLAPMFYVANTSRNGHLLNSRVFDQYGSLVKKSEYDLGFIGMPANQGLYMFKKIAAQTGSHSDLLSVVKYKIETEARKVNRETITEYRGEGPIKKTIDYTYNRPEQRRPSSATVTYGDGTQTVVHTKYATDYNLPSGSLSAELNGIREMQDKRIYDIPLEIYSTYVDENNNIRVTEGTLMDVRSSPVSAPKNIYTLKLTEAIPDFSPSAVNGINLVKDSRYSMDLEVLSYHSGLPGVFTSNNQLFEKKYFNALLNLPASISSGGEANSIYFTSFEDNNAMPWSGNNFTYVTNMAATGNSAAQLSNGTLTVSGLNATTSYLVSFYAASGASISVNGVLQTGSFTPNTSWTKFQTVVNGATTVQVTGSGRIDELRLMPVHTKLQTFTYNNKRQVTSMCDANNIITYYEYDNSGRLITVKDADGKILKTHRYQYLGSE